MLTLNTRKVRTKRYDLTNQCRKQAQDICIYFSNLSGKMLRKFELVYFNWYNDCTKFDVK